MLARGASADARPVAQAVFDACTGRPERIAQLALAARLLCLCAQNTGDHQLAQAAAVGALADIERFGDDRDFAVFLDTMSMWFGLSGFRRLASLVRRAATASYDARDPGGIAPLANLASSVIHDDPREGRQIAAEAVERCGDLGIAPLAAVGHFVVASLALGEWPEAIDAVTLQRAAACLAWGRADPTLMIESPEGSRDSTDLVVAGWGVMHAAVEQALGGDLEAGGRLAAKALELTASTSQANEDVPLAYSLAADLLLEAGLTAELDALTSELEIISLGQRFRLLHGMLVRVRALLDDSPGEGLRSSVSIFDAMGAAYWAARSRVDLAAALLPTDPTGAVELLDAAEPVLLVAGAVRALAQVADLRGSRVATPAPSV
jgi:hypothetical protein